MTAWNTLLDAVLDVDKPITYLIARIWRDNPIAIAEGSSGAPPIMGVNPQAVFSVTNVASLVITDLEAAGRIEIDLEGIKPATSNAELRVQFSLDNGATWYTGSNYFYAKRVTDSGGGGSASGSSIQSNIALTTTDHSNNATTVGTITLFNKTSSTRIRGIYSLNYARSSGAYTFTDGAFALEQYSGDINAMRIFFSTGNISGKATVRKIREGVTN